MRLHQVLIFSLEVSHSKQQAPRFSPCCHSPWQRLYSPYNPCCPSRCQWQQPQRQRQLRLPLFQWQVQPRSLCLRVHRSHRPCLLKSNQRQPPLQFRLPHQLLVARLDPASLHGIYEELLYVDG